MELNLKFKNKKEINELYKILLELSPEYYSEDVDKNLLEIFKKRLKKLYNKKPIKPRSGKQKGLRLQKYVCEKLAEIFNIEFDQQDDTCPIHSRESGQSGVDVVIRDKELLKKFPYAIECKNVEKFRIIDTIKQSEKHLEKNKDKYDNWLIFFKNNKLDYPVVILDIFEFFKIFKGSLK